MSSSPTEARTFWSTLFQFPNPVNDMASRTVAGVVTVVALVAIVFQLPWLSAVLAYGFLARVLTGPTLSPLAQLATRVVAPRIAPRPKLVAGPPKRFAQGMGATFTVLATIFYFGFGLAAVSYVLLGMLLVAAFLESVFDFCIGCQVFGLLMRIGVIPAEICTACANIQSRVAKEAPAAH